MNIPCWTSDQAAAIQVVVAAAQAVLTVIALGIAIGVPWWQQRMKTKDDASQRASETEALRLSLQTEVKMVARRCQMELGLLLHEPDQLVEPAPLDIPPLSIYHGTVSKFGYLSQNEILPLITWCGTLRDLEMLSNRVGQVEPALRHENRRELITGYLALACKRAADFLEAAPVLSSKDEDRQFIMTLRSSQKITMSTKV